MLAIRLARFGAKKKPTYRVVVIDKERARNSRSVEVVGHYNPIAKPAEIRITRPSADPGRELNGRSQQIIRDFGVAGPVGPSSRVSAF